MRSKTKPFNSIAFDLLQRKNQIPCRYCHDPVMRGTGRMVLDDSGTLAITAWACARCGAVIEEVRIMARGGKARLRPIRYAVALSHSIGRPVPVAYHGLRD